MSLFKIEKSFKLNLSNEVGGMVEPTETGVVLEGVALNLIAHLLQTHLPICLTSAPHECLGE